MSLIVEAKRKACYAAIDEYINSNTQVIGIGSGSTIVYCVERLRQRVDNEGLRINACIPTSFQARKLIMDANLPLGELNTFPELDVAFDGADEVDENLNCIKGGGGCHLQERLVAYNARKFVIVADDRKDSAVLGTSWKKGVPIEVLTMVYIPVMKKIQAIGGNPTLRMCEGGKAGPIVTDNGNFIVDADFGAISDPAFIDSEIRKIAGVVDTGLFIGMAEKVFFGHADGARVKGGAAAAGKSGAARPGGSASSRDDPEVNYEKITGDVNKDGLHRYELDFFETAAWTNKLLQSMSDNVKSFQASKQKVYKAPETNALCIQHHEILTYDFSVPTPNPDSDILHCKVSTLNLNENQRNKLIELAGSKYNPYKDAISLQLSEADELELESLPKIRRAKLLQMLDELITEAEKAEGAVVLDLRNVQSRQIGLEFPQIWLRKDNASM